MSDDGLQDSTSTTPPSSAPPLPPFCGHHQCWDLDHCQHREGVGVLLPRVHVADDLDETYGCWWVDLGTPCPVCAVDIGPHEHSIGPLVRATDQEPTT